MEQKKKEDFCLGSEGSGIIEDVGEGVDQNLKGRKCSFYGGGWCQFCVKKLDDIMLLDDSVDLKMAADSIVNPGTALSLMKLIREQKADIVVLDAANSTLGRMLV